MLIGNIDWIDNQVRDNSNVTFKLATQFSFYRIKILRHFPHNMKLDIFIKKGTHSTEDEINKQINDRERIAAAMENQNLWKLVEDCIKDED